MINKLRFNKKKQQIGTIDILIFKILLLQIQIRKQKKYIMLQELQQAASIQSAQIESGFASTGGQRGAAQGTSYAQDGSAQIEDQTATAINLVHYDPASKQYLVSAEAREFLRGIKEKVAVIAVAGKYRTGKSFLLNRVILNKRASGFGVGPTINPCTKGLWVWSECLEGRHNGEKMRILVVDSEGIGAFDEDVNHDTKIFLLALLLCSTFIFNSMNTIDENAINSLSLIINLSKELQVKKSEMLGESDPEDIQKFFPSFLWVVRDFSLRLIDSYGNTINQKQYLESALQPQKGSSDAVEQKNRIRRMIQLFFKDRDCFTMVRPVENERELQNLQQMNDEQFRPEFQQQLHTLRSRIMKKAKPKVLNGRVLTGEMLYELCIAYTEAINTGSVPNIQSAWSYVCQNECQRTITACIASYEERIRDPHDKAKDKLDLSILKTAHKSLVEQCASQFRRDALGGLDGESGQEMIQELEFKLRSMIDEKYKDIKRDFVRLCKVQAKKYLDEQTQTIRRGIAQQAFESLDQVQDRLEQVKAEYEGPRYPGYEILISETICQLVQKASDYFNMNHNQSSQMEQARLSAKVQDLEQQLKQARVEHQTERSEMQSSIAVLQAENAQLVKSEKLMQERWKIEQVESQSAFQRKEKELVNNIELKDNEVQALKHQLDIIEMQKRQADSSQNKKFTELEKLNALIEQKLTLTEQDLNDHKTKLGEKDKDLKELQKEHYQVRIEIQELKQKLARVDIDHEEELQQLRAKNEKSLAKLQEELGAAQESGQASGGTSGAENAKWLKEREQMTRQINLMTEQFDQQKKLQESLLQALNRQKEAADTGETDDQAKSVVSVMDSPQFLELQQKNQSLLQMNNNLSQQIVQMQSKQGQLEEDIRSLKKYKKIVNNSMAFQCKHCAVTLQKESFQDHLKSCVQDAERSRASVLLPPAPSGNQNSHHLQSSQRIQQARNSGVIGIGVPSPLQRARTSTIGRGYHGGASYIPPLGLQYQINIQNCEILTKDIMSLQDESTFCDVAYIIEVQSIEQYEWQVTKNLQDILGFLGSLRKAYSTFDFQGHGVVLAVHPPKETAEDIQFYFENVLKFEVQQLIEKLQKIPFIRDGPAFKAFFQLDRQQALEAEGQELDEVEIEADVLANVMKQAKKDRAAEMLNQIKALGGLQRESPQPFQRSGSAAKADDGVHGVPSPLLQEQEPVSKPAQPQSSKKHKFSLNLREGNEEERLAVEGGNGEELADSCGELDDKDRFKEVMASFRHDNSSRLGQRPISNRYNRGPLDDDLDAAVERDSLAAVARQRSDAEQPQLQKEGDSSDILCWTQESLRNLEMQRSPSHRLFKSNEKERPGSKAANHEISQSHSTYFNDCLNQKEAEPYLNSKQMALNKFLNSNLQDEDLNDRAEYPQTARQYFRHDSAAQIISQGLPGVQGRGGGSRNSGARQMQSFQNDAGRHTPLHQRPMDEDENVLSSQGTMEEQQSLRSYVHDLQASTSHGQSVTEQQHHTLGSQANKTSQQLQRAGEPARHTTGMHHKVASITSAQAGFIRTGTQRAAYLGSIPNQPARGPVPKQANSAVGRGSMKQGSSSKKKLNPAMSTSAISGSAAASKSRQKSSKLGGLSTMSYEPALQPQSQEGPGKKHSSISMTGLGNAHKQPSHVGQAKHKYLSPVLRQAPSKGYKS